VLIVLSLDKSGCASVPTSIPAIAKCANMSENGVCQGQVLMK